jgi:O-antigen/teichoic acid export membrane protein
MLPYAAAVTIGVLYPRIGILATSLGSGPRQTGYYSTAFKVVEIIGGTSGLLAGSAFPIFARAGRDDHERLRYASGRVSDTTMILGAYLALSLIVAAPFIIRVVGPPSFAPSVPVLRIQALALLGGFVATAWSATLLSLRRHRAILIATAVGLATAIVLSAIFVPSLGARGASIASAAAEFVVAGAYLVGLARAHPRLRPGLSIVPRLAVISLLAVIPSLVLSLPSLALWAIASVVFAVLAWLFRIVPPELVPALAEGIGQVRSRFAGRAA